MSIASKLMRKSEPPACCRQPNELDQMRVTRVIAERARYRYVVPSVVAVDEGSRR